MSRLASPPSLAPTIEILIGARFGTRVVRARPMVIGRAIIADLPPAGPPPAPSP